VTFASDSCYKPVGVSLTLLSEMAARKPWHEVASTALAMFCRPENYTAAVTYLQF